MSTLRLVLPDQLSKDNPVFDNIKYEDILLFYEPIDTFYENSHHKQKIVYLISSMRSFVAKNKHKKIIHKKIQKDNNKFADDLLKITSDNNIKKILVAKPSDFKTNSECF